MGDIYFTTNPAEFSKLPGLYVSERKPPGFVRGADLSTVGMAGRCVRGPDDPQTITSPGRFIEIYGERDYGSGGALVGQIWAGMLNKPFGTIIARRVRASDAVKASFTLETAAGGGGTAVLRVDASSVGIWGNLVGVTVSAASDAVSNHFNLTARFQGRTVLYQNLDITAGNDNTALAVGSDPARLIDLVKLADGRPVNNAPSTDGADASGFVLLGQSVANFTSVAGSEGTLAVTDYNAGMNDLAVFPGIGIALVPEIVTGSVSTFHSNLVTLAAAVSDRIFLTWSQVHGQSFSTEVTNIGAQITTRTDRIMWCYNSPWTVDPKNGQEIQTGPHTWMASILSQIDVDVHAGSSDTVPFLAGIKRVTNTALQRGDLIALKAAGISTLERLEDGFQFRDAVTTSLTVGLTELARRRMADFLQISAARRLRVYVKGKNIPEQRLLMIGELLAFGEQLKNAKRVVERHEVKGDGDANNSEAQRAIGEEHILWRVKLIGHMLSVVLETEIATGTVIEQN